MNITWKGNDNSKTSVIPTNSRPFSNHSELLPTGRVSFKPNPIKHWRKQLKPTYKTQSKQVSISSVNAPSSVVALTTDTTRQSLCDSNITSQILHENVILLNNCYGIRKSTDMYTTCEGGTNHVRRSANTNVSKRYHTSHAKYLQSKCKTYEQNISYGKRVSDTVFKGSKCSQSLANSCEHTITFKPSNKAFSQQGAVSASTQIQKRKNQALTKNSASLKNAYGTAPVFIRDYKPNSTGYEIYYVKGNMSDTQGRCDNHFKSCRKS